MKQTHKNLLLGILAICAVLLIIGMEGRLRSVPPAHASGLAVVQVQSTQTNSNISTTTISTSAGDLIVVFEGANDYPAAANATPTDSGGNTYSLAVKSIYGPGATDGSFYYSASSSPVTSVTCNWAASNGNFPCIVYDISGAGNAGVFDVATSSFGSSTASNATSGLLTTTNANDILLFGTRAGANETWSNAAGPGYTLPANATTTRGAVDYQILSNTTSSASTTLAFSASTTNIGAFVAFKALSVLPGTATSTWIAVSSTSWSNAGNWSGGFVPGATTTVLFSASSTVSSTIDTSTAIFGFIVSSTYSGTITQSSSYTIAVGTSSYSQASGTFNGGTGAITINGPFNFTGGTFKSTSGNLNINGSSTFGGTFQNNSGTVIFSSTSTSMTIGSSTTFYNLQLGDGSGTGNNTITIPASTVITVQGTLTFAPSSTEIYLLGGGQINAQGNVALAGAESGTAPTSTFSLFLNGSGSQIITDNGYGTTSQPFYLPSTTINNSTGLILVSSTFLSMQNLTVATGELRIASNTAAQTFIVSSTAVISSGGILSDYPQASSTITIGSSTTNNGLVFFDGSGGSCLASPAANYVILRSTVSGTQSTWSGSGYFVFRYANVKDQTSSVPISVWDGTSAGNNGANWSFTTAAEPELVQTSTASGGSGTTNLGLPAFGFKPRVGDLLVVAVSARNQTITAPTDNASNTYTLISSSTFGSSPSYAFSLYYAKNILATSSFTITVHGGGGSGQFLSAGAFEYTGINPSSTFDKYTANTAGSSTALTSFTASGQSTGELYFGALTFAASTTASPGSGWTAEAGITNNNTTQALYVEDVASTSQLTTAATWTAATSTGYAAAMAIFHSPYQQVYVASGTLDSATFDTGVASGTQLNSFIWQGSTPSNSSVKFQFAVSNSSSGPWNFEGPDGTASTYFSGTAGTPIGLLSSSNGYTLFNGYRYFRYRATLFADSGYVYTPTITQVSVNWSP
jgi:hypothetical protein